MILFIYLFLFCKCFCCLIKTMTADCEYSERRTALIKYYGRIACARAGESHYNTWAGLITRPYYGVWNFITLVFTLNLLHTFFKSTNPVIIQLCDQGCVPSALVRCGTWRCRDIRCSAIESVHTCQSKKAQAGNQMKNRYWLGILEVRGKCLQHQQLLC